MEIGWKKRLSRLPLDTALFLEYRKYDARKFQYTWKFEGLFMKPSCVRAAL